MAKKRLLGCKPFRCRSRNQMQRPRQANPVSQNWVLRKSKTCHEKEQTGRDDTGAVNLVSHVETNLSSVAAFFQMKILAMDMPGFMQVHAFQCAQRNYDSLQKFRTKHMAYNM